MARTSSTVAQPYVRRCGGKVVSLRAKCGIDKLTVLHQVVARRVSQRSAILYLTPSSSINDLNLLQPYTKSGLGLDYRYLQRSVERFFSDFIFDIEQKKMEKKSFSKIYVKDAAAKAAGQMSFSGAMLPPRPHNMDKVGVDTETYV